MTLGKKVATAAGEGGIRGILEPIAKIVAKWISRVTPQSHWLRSEVGVSVVSGLGQFAESLASQSAIGRVASDFVGDVLKSAFGDDKGPPSENSIDQAAKAWVEDWLKDADKRLAKASVEDLPDLRDRLRVEFDFKVAIWKEFRRMVCELDGDHRATEPSAPFDWDRHSRRLARAIQRQFPRTRPTAHALTADPGELPPVGSRYGAGSGAVELQDTLFTAATATGDWVVRATRALLIVLGLIAGVTLVSLRFGMATGLIVGMIALASIPAIIFFMYPKVTWATIVVAWLGWTPSASRLWPFIATLIGAVLALAIAFMWWPVWFTGAEDTPELWRHTLVLSVFILLAIAGASAFRALGVAVLAILIIAVAVALGVVGYRLIATNSTPAQTQRPAVRTYTLTPGEVLVLGINDSILVTVPARMLEPACIRHAPGVRNFWTEPVAGEMRVSPDCGSNWRTESPGNTRSDGRLLDGIGVKNPTSQDAKFLVRSRS